MGGSHQSSCQQQLSAKGHQQQRDLSSTTATLTVGMRVTGDSTRLFESTGIVGVNSLDIQSISIETGLYGKPPVSPEPKVSFNINTPQVGTNTSPLLQVPGPCCQTTHHQVPPHQRELMLTLLPSNYTSKFGVRRRRCSGCIIFRSKRPRGRK